MAAVAEPPRKPGRPKDPDLESRRKAEILDAAAVVFAADGFAETDVQVVADRVGVSKGVGTNKWKAAKVAVAMLARIYTC